jgi:4'-phosphopantetheinyl transferase
VPPPPAVDPAGALPGIDLASTVVVTVQDAAPTRAGDHRALAKWVARLTGTAPAAVSLRQSCPVCGETGHGPLSVAGARATAPVQVSLSRAGGRVAFAVTGAGRVGIDMDLIADLGRAPIANVLLSPAETAGWAAVDRAATAAELTALWTTKEAVLKATGLGLRVDPRDLTVALDRTPGPGTGPAPGAGRRLVSWWAAPVPVAEIQVLSVAAPPGSVITVAVLTAERPALVVRPLG